MKFVSIIVLNYNGKQYLSDCFKSLKKIDYPKSKYEVILADNDSKDGSVEFTKKKFPWVKIAALDGNYGFSDGNNLAVKRAKGDLIALLNNDAKVHKKWLSELVKNMHGDVVICASKLVNFDRPDLIDYDGAVITFTGKGYSINFGVKDYKRTEPTYTGYPSGAAMLVKRSFWKNIGGLDSDYFIYEDDTDMGLQAWLMGYKVLYVPTSIAYHKFGGITGKKLSPMRVYNSQKNSIMNILKNFEIINIPKALLFNFGLSIMEALYLVKSGNPKNIALIFKAYYFNIVNIRKTLKKRAKIQKKRKLSDRKIIEMGWIEPVFKSLKEYMRNRA